MPINFVDLGAAVPANVIAAVDALRLQIDTRLGYPRTPTKPDGSPYIDNSNPNFGVTNTCARLIAHPVDGTRFAFPIAQEMVAHLAAIKAAIAAKIAAGTASAVEQRIANLPAPGALDASWVPPAT